MRVIGDKNRISEYVFDFMISFLPFPKKSIRSELAKFFSHQYSSTKFEMLWNLSNQAHFRRADGGIHP